MWGYGLCLVTGCEGKWLVESNWGPSTAGGIWGRSPLQAAAHERLQRGWQRSPRCRCRGWKCRPFWPVLDLGVPGTPSLRWRGPGRPCDDCGAAQSSPRVWQLAAELCCGGPGSALLAPVWLSVLCAQRKWARPFSPIPPGLIVPAVKELLPHQCVSTICFKLGEPCLFYLN